MNPTPIARHQARLLTFSHLPLPFFNQPDDAPFEAVCELTSRSRFFEQHYLQRTSWQSIVPSSADFHDSLIRLTVIAGRPFAAPDFEHEVVDHLAKWQKPTDPGLHWLHVENDCEWPVNFVEAVNSVWPGDAAEIPLVITALNGSRVDMPGMDSAIAESQLRVPLWVVDNSSPGRYQRLSGSLDLLPSLLETIGDSGLAPLAIDLPERESVVIQHSEIKAVRRHDFLYVDNGEKEALYSKPTDCWNTNDVSREHFDTVDEMAAELRAAR